MTPERAAEWKQNLQQLLQLGPDAVPAVAEFLETNTDYNFDRQSSQLLGQHSARKAMLEALAEIGGPEATALMADTLRTTGAPREIAMLAAYLEKLAPEQHGQLALEAARQTLAMATERKLEGFDVAPLFEVLQRFGGASAVTDFEQAASQWKYYATIALAQLPDGAGVPALVRMTEDANGKPNPNRHAALEMLAQLSTTYPDARTALVEQARANRIPPSIWPYLAPLLAGDQVYLKDAVFDGGDATREQTRKKTAHIAYGNQNFGYAPPTGGFTVDQLNERLRLIDDLRSVTSAPDAVKVLDNTRAQLVQDLAHVSTPKPN